jgi:hypothetical protein
MYVVVMEWGQYHDSSAKKYEKETKVAFISRA